MRLPDRGGDRVRGGLRPPAGNPYAVSQILPASRVRSQGLVDGARAARAVSGGAHWALAFDAGEPSEAQLAPRDAGANRQPGSPLGLTRSPGSPRGSDGSGRPRRSLLGSARRARVLEL